MSDWRDILRPRRVAGLYERGRTILGEAGLGKSSLVCLIADQAADNGDWVTPQLRIPTGADPLKKVADALLKLSDRAGLPARQEDQIVELIGRVRAVAAAGVSLSLREATSRPEPHQVITDLLVELGQAAIRDRDRLIVIHVDEMQNIEDRAALSQLLIALGDALAHEETVTAPGGIEIQRYLPIAVYLTGLPEFNGMASARHGATFARRFQTTVLSPVPDDDMNAALQQFVTEGWPEVLETKSHKVH